MKLLSYPTFIATLTAAVVLCAGLPVQASLKDVKDYVKTELDDVKNCVKTDFSKYFASHPYIALTMDEVTYGPITVSNIRINDRQVTPAAPGEVLNGQLLYKVNSEDQEFLHRYHLVVGLKGVGAQDCVTHTYGVWDSAGKGTFALKAPMEKGVYEVRFAYTEATTCDQARSIWHDEAGEPSAQATIGLIIVE
jgi:hypothetical protein